MDIETINIDGVQIPICITLAYFYSESKLFLIDPNLLYKDYNKAIANLFSKLYLFINENSLVFKNIFCHNLGNFDGIFLLRKITNLFQKVKPILRNGNIIYLKVYFGINKTYSLTFFDSFLLLPSSLRKLASAFGVPQQKTIFPYSFANKVELNYKGVYPKYEYFNTSEVTLEEYQLYKKQMIDGIWDLRKETIKYCIEDCVALHQVIYEFGVEILDMFYLDIFKTPTLPSLSLAVYL